MTESGLYAVWVKYPKDRELRRESIVVRKEEAEGVAEAIRNLNLPPDKKAELVQIRKARQKDIAEDIRVGFKVGRR